MKEMRKVFYVFVFVVSLFAINNVNAEQKYNLYSGQWETVTPNSELQYNPHSGQWGYSAPDLSPQYNHYENRWDMAPNNSV
jgi:hypothetical protein